MILCCLSSAPSQRCLNWSSLADRPNLPICSLIYLALFSAIYCDFFSNYSRYYLKTDLLSQVSASQGNCDAAAQSYADTSFWFVLEPGFLLYVSLQVTWNSWRFASIFGGWNLEELSMIPLKLSLKHSCVLTPLIFTFTPGIFRSGKGTFWHSGEYKPIEKYNYLFL